MLRSASLKIIRALGIEGGCNVQFALDPRRRVGIRDAAAVLRDRGEPARLAAPRRSRRKATGYPIARVAAKIAVGKRLDEIPNAVTQQDDRRVRAGARLLSSSRSRAGRSTSSRSATARSARR